MNECKINNKKLLVPFGTTVAAALLLSNEMIIRDEQGDNPRVPLCGMGICFECRVTINGKRNERGCLILVDQGMEISTHG